MASEGSKLRKTIKEKKKERLKIVKEMYLNGMRVCQIARELDCATSTISSDVRELGIRREEIDYEEIILKMLKEGKHNNEIGKELGICPTRVTKVRRKHGMARDWFIVQQEVDLIDENTKYANNSIVLEKVTIGGKQYTDITQMLSPR